MVTIKKQIDYWINAAEDDLLTADLLIREKRILHGKTKDLLIWLKEML